MGNMTVSRRDLLKGLAAAALVRRPGGQASLDLQHLAAWTATLRAEDAAAGLGARAVRVGELAAGSPYQPFTLEAYIKGGGNPAGTEPLTLSLSHFDCVSLVEACLAVARAAATPGQPSWERFGIEVERMRYRGGKRLSYSSRLHYFSEWIRDGASRGLVRDLGEELGGEIDARPLRFMTEHRASYPALANETVFNQIGVMERSLDPFARRLVPVARIPAVLDRIQSGDVIAFATNIPGLDVSHAAFAYRDTKNVVRVLHAPLSGGVVEVTRTTLPEYVAAIRRATGILVARPL
jgi:hypothetical protein